jgi:hypothetical protein
MEARRERQQGEEEVRRAGTGGPVPDDDQTPEQRRAGERLCDGSPAVERRRQEQTDESR